MGAYYCLSYTEIAQYACYLQCIAIGTILLFIIIITIIQIKVMPLNVSPICLYVEAILLQCFTPTCYVNT